MDLEARSPRSAHRSISGRAATVVAAALLALSAGPQTPLAQPAGITRSELAEQLPVALDALAAAAVEIPRVSFDPAAVLAAAGGTPSGAFAWVRDNTRLVPYPGSLRGPRGVLLDGTGNSLDRALLLHELVTLAGSEARLAHATLSVPELEAAPGGAVSAVAGAAEQAPATTEATALDALVTEYQLDPTFVAQAVRSVRAPAELLFELDDRVKPQAAFLGDRLGAEQSPVAASDDRRVAALADHWWVQYREGDAWIDLDPTLPDAEPGEPLMAAAETMDLAAASGLPQELRHTLELTVVLECALDTGLVESVLLTSGPLVPASLIGERLSVQFVPSGFAAAAAGALDDAALGELVLEQNSWFPAISVGGESVYDLEFNADCETTTATAPWLGDSVAAAAEGAADVFGDLFAAAPEDAVTAVHIDLAVAEPDGEVATHRTTVFDNLGAAARRAGRYEPTSDPGERLAWRLALLGETEVLATVGALTPDYVADLLTSTLLAQRDAITALATSAEGDEAEALEALQADATPLPSALYDLALARQQGMPAEIYFPALNLLTRYNRLQANADGVIARYQGFDIVTNEVAVLPGTSDARALVIEQGVRDTNAETLLEQALCAAAISGQYCRTFPNPADLLAASGVDQAEEWLTVRDAAELATAALPWSEDALAALANDLDAGYVAVVPRGVSESAAETDGSRSWWRLDPRTGATLGVDQFGRGNVAAEYTMLINFIGFAFCEVGAVRGGAAVAGTVACTFGLATGTGALLAGTGHLAGILGLAATILYGLGGFS